MEDLMKKAILCKYCSRPEYYGEMRWLNGRCMCRKCYKAEYEILYRKPYCWDDLDGKIPQLSDVEVYE